MRQYSTSERAKATARLLAGDSLDAVAEATGVPRSTLSTWRKEARALVPVVGTRERTDGLGSEIFDLMAETLVTLTAQARFFRDVEWLSKQSAGDLAILHGVLNDKTVRLLAAMRDPGDAQQRAAAEQPPGEPHVL